MEDGVMKSVRADVMDLHAIFGALVTVILFHMLFKWYFITWSTGANQFI